VQWCMVHAARRRQMRILYLVWLGTRLTMTRPSYDSDAKTQGSAALHSRPAQHSLQDDLPFSCCLCHKTLGSILTCARDTIGTTVGAPGVQEKQHKSSMSCRAGGFAHRTRSPRGLRRCGRGHWAAAAQGAAAELAPCSLQQPARWAGSAAQPRHQLRSGGKR
jgi:hypothetical protein